MCQTLGPNRREQIVGPSAKLGSRDDSGENTHVCSNNCRYILVLPCEFSQDDVQRERSRMKTLSHRKEDAMAGNTDRQPSSDEASESPPEIRHRDGAGHPDSGSALGDLPDAATTAAGASHAKALKQSSEAGVRVFRKWQDAREAASS